jgi:threonine/homoserine/homoserine lactone efflux protein
MLVSPCDSDQPDELKTLRKMYLQAALVTAGNPKAIVFFTAIFPQFINPHSAYLFQAFILIGLCAIIAFGCFMIYAISGQKIVSLFSKASVGKYLIKIIGGTFIGAGIGLAANSK